MDSDTQFMKYGAYASDMKRNFRNEKHIDVVMLNLGSFSSINAMMGYDFSMLVLNDVVERIRKVNRLLDNKGSCTTWIGDDSVWCLRRSTGKGG